MAENGRAPATSTWGALLATCGVPGIYRSQASLAPGMKVRTESDKLQQLRKVEVGSDVANGLHKGFSW
jgi:hypothetical protein